MPGINGFPRKERLTRRSEFLAVYRSGDKQVGRDFICYVARREGQGRKFGFAVSQKVGGAVVRNRVKRLLRELYRLHRTQLADDAHIVIVARPPSAALSFEECAAAMRQLLTRGGALSG